MDNISGSKKDRRLLFNLVAALVVSFGFVNYGCSFVTTAKGHPSIYKLQCSQLIVGSACTGYIDRGGGGMCRYHSPFYTLSSASGLKSKPVELYIPLTTCSRTTELLTPVIDVILARIIFAALIVGGLAVIGSSFVSTPKLHDKYNSK